MPITRALMIGVVVGALWALPSVFVEKYGKALTITLIAAIGVAAFLYWVMPTKLGPRGFAAYSRQYGHHSYDWSDVVDARIFEARLHIQCRYDIKVVLPANVLSDPDLPSQLQTWLPSEHPINRALREYPRKR
jgi:hypothetical protein